LNQHPISLFIITQKDPFVKQENDFFCALADDRILSDIPKFKNIVKADEKELNPIGKKREAAAWKRRPQSCRLSRSFLRLQQQS